MQEAIKLSKEDIDSLVELEKICFPDDAYKKETFIEMMNDERVFVFGYKDDTKLTGMIFLYNWKGLKDFIKIINIGVHPDYRNKGYCHDFIKLTIDMMKEDNLSKVKAETRKSNIPMQKVLEDFGFTIDEEIDKYYTNPEEDAYRYQLKV
ncbi:GNAT family N-acetyltransferase [Acidaminobacter sp. JC074]|uniref:GNAT family N-acetyltransferase n=1 Tax=Acidaminobacter sp. JC074 TaxID=2530199 RepID=UPI001F0E37BD|nr:GNAT family N-acetyltransferase [Acidaminobacter sp. JC074]MCH4886760.1 GNAT family N-acetyltransferase [Acidaminobacter sp. JC074]